MNIKGTASPTAEEREKSSVLWIEGREGKGKRKRGSKVKRPESESGEVGEGGCGERGRKLLRLRVVSYLSVTRLLRGQNHNAMVEINWIVCV